MIMVKVHEARHCMRGSFRSLNRPYVARNGRDRLRIRKNWHFGHVLSGRAVGRRLLLGSRTLWLPDVTDGNGCKIQNNVASIKECVILEDGVFCGPSMVFSQCPPRRAPK